MHLQGGQVQFNGDDDDYQWYFVWYMSLAPLCCGYTSDDNMIIVAEFSIKESQRENQLDHGARIADPIKSGFQDFRGLGNIEKDLVPLREEERCQGARNIGVYLLNGNSYNSSSVPLTATNNDVNLDGLADSIILAMIS